MSLIIFFLVNMTSKASFVARFSLTFFITTIALKLMPGLDYKNDWKLINLQIGSKKPNL
jgi:hypothetical protein